MHEWLPNPWPSQVAVLEASADRVGGADTVVLQAGKSFDPDAVQGVADFSFQWSCVGMWSPAQTEADREPCTRADGKPVAVTSSGATATFTPTDLGLRSNQIYEFRVTVTAHPIKTTDALKRCV